MFVAQCRNTERGIAARKHIPQAPKQVEEPAQILDMVQERARREHEARLRRIDAMNAAVRAQVEIERLKALEQANAILAELRADNARYRHTVREIERRACKLFKLSRSELRSNRRLPRVIIARHFAMYWAARLTLLSLPQIGRLMGGRDHTTICHGRDKHVERRAAMGRKLRSLKQAA